MNSKVILKVVENVIENQEMKIKADEDISTL